MRRMIAVIVDPGDGDTGTQSELQINILSRKEYSLSKPSRLTPPRTSLKFKALCSANILFLKPEDVSTSTPYIVNTER